jgi:DNA-binding GntR family transcriptional regulator
MAYTTIKDAIITLKFQPGRALSHRDLAGQLQISETPIRDALQELEREGFVIRIPHKGTFVTIVEKLDIEETFQIRAPLEELADGLATPQLGSRGLGEVEELLRRADVALARGDREQCSVLGAEFHQYFILRAGNRRLATILRNLDDHLQRFRRISDLITGRLEKSQKEHRHVYEAACRGQAEQAGEAMYLHVRSVLADIKEMGDDWLDHIIYDKLPDSRPTLS